MNSQLHNKRMGELLALADEERIRLPWPAPVIAALEDRGYYVDLVTGLIGRETERYQLTPQGAAWLAQNSPHC